MTSFLYINISDSNKTNAAKVINLSASRNTAMLPQDLANYSISVERFLLEKAIIPIFQLNNDLQVKIGGNVQTISMTTDANNFIYNINDLVVAINVAINAAAVSQLLSGADIPVLSIDHTTGIASLSYSSTFRDGHTLELNSEMYKIFSSFMFTTGPDSVSAFYELVLTGSSTSTASQVNTNPISRLVLETISIPIDYEYVGSGQDQAKILTDFSFSASYLQESLSNIRYSSEQRYRRHQMGSSITWRTSDIAFAMETYGGEKIPITIYPGGRVDCKLVVEKIHN